MKKKFRLITQILIILVLAILASSCNCWMDYKEPEYKEALALSFVGEGGQNISKLRLKINTVTPIKVKVIPQNVKNSNYSISILADGKEGEDASAFILDSKNKTIMGMTYSAKARLKVTLDSNNKIADIMDIYVEDMGVMEQMNMVYVEGGTITLGSYELDSDKILDIPDFYICDHEVTQGEWKSVMGNDNNPSTDTSSDNLPVNNVSWYEAIEFCNLLSEEKGLTPYYTIDKSTIDQNNTFSPDPNEPKWTISINSTANGFRLPTEAEWEFAARGGIQSLGYTYSGSNAVGEVAWYSENSLNSHSDPVIHPVKSKQENELGLYDMSGNVYEWCWDWYGNTNYGEDILGPESGMYRVKRGGSFFENASFSTVFIRDFGECFLKSSLNGLRVACSVSNAD